MLQDWGLFRPFALHFDRALQRLPRVSTVLYRGLTRCMDPNEYRMGATGSFGGVTSASIDRRQAAAFLSKADELKAAQGSFLMILSDVACPIYHLSLFPEELEHLHPLDLVLEVCNVLPVSVLQMLCLKISIVAFKRAGAALSVPLWLQAYKELGCLYDDFLRAYVPPLVKESPGARVAFGIRAKVEEFVAAPWPVLLIAAQAGLGKTSCALWLTHRPEHLGRIWLFVSLPSVEGLFTDGALVRHITTLFGFEGNDAALRELKARPLVWVLDSLDEVERPRVAGARSLWELNALDEWNVKLLVTCREEHVDSHAACLGDRPRRLYLQPFREDQVEEYVKRRLQALEGSAGSLSIPTHSRCTFLYSFIVSAYAPPESTRNPQAKPLFL